MDRVVAPAVAVVPAARAVAAVPRVALVAPQVAAAPRADPVVGTPPPPLSSNVQAGPTGGGTQSGGSTGQQSNPNAPATLIITKSTCPAGYDLYGDKASVTKDCTNLTQDIDFGLTSLTVAVQNGTPVPNAPVSQTTG